MEPQHKAGTESHPYAPTVRTQQRDKALEEKWDAQGIGFWIRYSSFEPFIPDFISIFLVNFRNYILFNTILFLYISF
jgi:hypothetical protein